MDIDKDLNALKRVKSRVETTKNEDLEALLFKLLPKILVYADNQAELIREEAKSIIQYSLNRSKTLGLQLPCSGLIDTLGNDDNKIFSITMCIDCLDYGILSLKNDDEKLNCSRSILKALHKTNWRLRDDLTVVI